jgi:hypothetical protein
LSAAGVSRATRRGPWLDSSRTDFVGNESSDRVVLIKVWNWVMIGRDYLARQAATLLRLARLTKDAGQAAQLAAKAVELTERRDATPPRADISPLPPDIEVLKPTRQNDRH